MPAGALNPRQYLPKTIAVASLVTALWLATHAYTGVIHDSRLYTLQALARLRPEIRADLFLAYGSQDAFSIISAVYSPLIAALGISGSNIVLLLASSMVWVAATWWLARRWLGDGDTAIAGLAGAIAFPSTMVNVFQYGEAFFTARLPAEVFVIAAVAALIGRQRLLAAGLLITAALFHPLIALPGIVFAVLYEGRDQPRVWLIAGAGAIAVGALAAFGIAPFDRLLQQLDPEWLAIVRRRNFYCYISEWRLAEWVNVTNIGGTTALALAFGSRAQRPLLFAAAITAALGMAASFMGTDVLHNVLLTGLQAWRSLWLLALLSHLALAPVILALLRGGSSMPATVRPPFLMALAALVLAPFVDGLALIPTAGSIAALVINHWARRGRPLPAVVAIVGVAVSGVVAASSSYGFCAWIGSPLLAGRDWSGIVVTIATLALLARWLRPAPAAARRSQPIAAGFAVVLALVAAGLWDQRTAWRRFVETASPPPGVKAILAHPGQAYWESDPTLLWLMMRQPSYFSYEQGSGVLFSRATAVEYSARRRAFFRFGTIDFQGRDHENAGSRDRSPPQRDRASLTALCRSQPGLGAVVLLSPVAGARGQVWQSPVDYRYPGGTAVAPIFLTTRRFYAYSCRDLRPSVVPAAGSDTAIPDY